MSAEGAWQLQNIREVRSKRVVRGILKRVVSEPGADTAESFARRVRLLAATYAHNPWVPG
ncbi:MAG: hypothetical protein AUG04_08285 [Deltaproteobacteria bacterium 13_1_20CM_2_69_21]|nr:MAG: hypothetical protein AUH83_10875 [Deltaproteobacteria bacterium 13_1_40CM_4_68_19]OLD10147.1 MAG: hypothetical protein AUI90_01805 [Deltaproteobacteria bacterium 13_1_40CM_3_69_14]OLD45512.1 MAG: hypothetical protein AUI48_12535 [Chloroflexi bacterium 13_1_40CM_2_68_14]OLE62772.1 MAG: hypothetical protein AUG04_08285 [Deltaproteobacteria bacterium 13_1_20CM_2_69_21]